MSTNDNVILGTGLDLSGWDRGFQTAAGDIDSFTRSAAKQLEGLSMPAPSFGGQSGGSGAGASPLPDLAGAIAPLAGQLQAAINKSLAPLNGFAARISGQFDLVGKVLVNAAVKADKQIRFNKIQENIRGASAAISRSFTEIEGRVGQFARNTVRALDFSSAVLKVKNSFDQLRNIRFGKVNELANLKAPNLDFSTSIKSMLTLNGATAAATTAFKGLGVQIALSLGIIGVTFQAVSAAVSFVKTGITSAVTLNETLSKTSAIFGQSAGVIVSESERMSKAFGTSKNDYINAATNFGAVFKGVGKSQAEAAKMGNTLAQLGMDMASFDNTANSDAFTAISSALRGEMDPIEKYRVFLSADKVAAEALALGLARGKSEITETAKKMATMSLIMKQTKDAQGDLTRTADGTANKQRSLTGIIANLGTTIGQTLLPAVDRGIAFLTSFAALASSAFAKARPWVDSFVNAVGYGFDLVATAAGALGPVLLGIGSAIVGAATSGGSALLSFLPDFGSVVDTVKSALLSVQAFVGDVATTIGGLFGPSTLESIGGFASMIGGAVSQAFSIMGFAVRNAQTLVEIAFITGGAYVNQFLGNLALIPENLGRIGSYLANNWVELALTSIALVGEAIRALADSFWKFITNPTGGFQLDFSAVTREFESLKTTIGKVPAMATAGLADVGPELEKAYGKIADREREHAAKMGAATVTPEFKAIAGAKPAAAAGPSEAGKKADPEGEREIKFAGAAELGSKEAYSSIVQALTGGRSEGLKAIEQISRDQLDTQQQGNDKLDRIATGIESLNNSQDFDI